MSTSTLPSLSSCCIHQVQDWFFSSDNHYSWLRQLAIFARTVRLESLQLKALGFGMSNYTNSSNYDYFSRITDGTLEDLAHGPCINRYLFSTSGGGSGNGGVGDSLCDLRKLWLSAPNAGPSITAGMAAVGGSMPRLEELVVDRLKVTDDGWRRFATARNDTIAAAASGDNSGSRQLRRIKIRANGTAMVPSATTRGLLEDTVSESVTLYLDHQCLGTAAAGGDGGIGGSGASGGDSSSSGGGSGSGSGNVSGNDQYVDCAGAPIELDDKEKISADNAKTRMVKITALDLPGGGVEWMLTT